MKKFLLIFALITLSLCKSDVNVLKEQFLAKNSTNGTLCSLKGSVCGHEAQHEKCCANLTCVYVQRQGLGSKGFCVDQSQQQQKQKNGLCGKFNETCGHEYDHQKCCDGLQCVRTYSIFGTSGKCQNQTSNINVSNQTLIQNKTNKTQLCSSQGQVCGHELHHQKCCEGYECKNNASILGGKGQCVKRQNNTLVCAKSNQTCGHEFGQARCCEGFSCVSRPGLKGGSGKCLPTSTLQQNSTKNSTVCASLNQECGHELAHQKCCKGYTCNKNSTTLGGKGVCVRQQENPFKANTTNNTVCSTYGQSCGKEQGQQNCCEGFVCVKTSSNITANATCRKFLSNDFKNKFFPNLTNQSNSTNKTNKTVCGAYGQECGHEKDHTRCCDGFTCVFNSKIIGSKGRCQSTQQNKTNQTHSINKTNSTHSINKTNSTHSINKTNSTHSINKTNSSHSINKTNSTNSSNSTQKNNTCVTQDQSCGHELAHAKCCDGYKCVVNTQIAGSKGKCQKIKNQQALCSKLNEICTHDKGQQCCEGFTCSKISSIFGSSGRCVQQTQK